MATTGEHAQPEPELPTIIDLGGDVTLAVGTETTQLRLRVSKALLSLASKYFATLLGPSFREGADASEKKDIELSDDDSKAMSLLCKILHMQYQLPTKSLSPDELLGLAVVGDKYGCVKALALSVRSIFPEKTDTAGTTFEHIGKLVCAAYPLDNAPLFERLTHAMFTDYVDSFVPVGHSEAGQLLPSSIWLTLQGRRAKIFAYFTTKLTTGLVAGCPNVARYQRARTFMDTQVRNMAVAGLMPLKADSESIHTVLNKIVKLKIADFTAINHTACSLQCPTIGFQPNATTLLAKTVEKGCIGLCLDYVKGQGKELGGCRIVHA